MLIETYFEKKLLLVVMVTVSFGLRLFYLFTNNDATYNVPVRARALVCVCLDVENTFRKGF